MAADAIIYCLENLTDYTQFERLSSDIMLCEGFNNIEPLGGFKDKGRDAIHVSKDIDSKTAIFTYSVRSDWLKKLLEDSEKIIKHNHQCNKIVMVTTALFSATDRDNAISLILDKYGWELHLYGIERIRSILSVNQHLLANHPQIFCPPFFRIAGGLSLSLSLNYILIDYSDPDEMISTWLARKLKLNGYLVWCRSIDPIAGESINDTTIELIKKRAFFYLAILSEDGLADVEFSFRRSTAIIEGKNRDEPFIIPINSSELPDSRLEAELQKLESIQFCEEWLKGFQKLVEKLEGYNCPRSSEGKYFALNSFLPTNTVKNKEEKLYSNVFPVIEIPEAIHRYITDDKVSSDMVKLLRAKWAFRKVDAYTFLSFHHPPTEYTEVLKLKQAGGSAWRHVDDIDGIYSINLVIELIKKSLQVVCENKGLHFCHKTWKHYFPEGFSPSNRLSVTMPNGKKTNVSAVGQRKYYSPIQSENYKYYLCPDFYVKKETQNNFSLMVRIYIRISDEKGKPIEGRKINSRRKALCRDWYNKQWFSRILAVMQFLGNGSNIVLGQNTKEEVRVGIQPFSWTVNKSIDEGEPKTILKKTKV